jgi:nitroreductase
MNLDKIINSRFSVRSHLPQKVGRETIEEILDIARMAPSAVNFQPWHFIAATEPESLAILHEAYPRNWFREAPVCIVVCADRSQSWKRKSDGKDFADVDATIVIDHLVLKATEMGLGTCWVCNFDVPIVREQMNLPGHIEPLALIPLGYTNVTPPEKSRKPLSELLHWEKFTNR